MSSAAVAVAVTSQACQKRGPGSTRINVSVYPDHGSPVRKAREAARSRLPCEACGATGEPMVRRPRPYSPDASENPGAYFACPECGRRLSELTGPAADRPSDDPLDQLPDPHGMLVLRIQPPVQEAPAADRLRVLDETLARVASEHGLGLRPVSRVLLWRGKPWLKLGLDGDRVVIERD